MHVFTHVSAMSMEARRGCQILELQAVVSCLKQKWQLNSCSLGEACVCLPSEPFFQLWIECFETGSVFEA